MVLALRDNLRTREQYPYSFLFRVAFRLDNNSLTTSYICRNLGEREMYYMAGGHPAFNCPLQSTSELRAADRFKDCCLVFEYPETLQMPADSARWHCRSGRPYSCIPKPERASSGSGTVLQRHFAFYSVEIPVGKNVGLQDGLRSTGLLCGDGLPGGLDS